MRRARAPSGERGEAAFSGERGQGPLGPSAKRATGPERLAGKWRREGDSNPRYSFWPYNDLANRRLQPLGHLSAGWELSVPIFT